MLAPAPLRATYNRLVGSSVFIDRATVVAVQTPQAFRAEALREAHRDEPHASDDATLVEMIGGKVVIVPGETTNFKITTSHDLKVARMIVADEGAS